MIHAILIGSAAAILLGTAYVVHDMLRTRQAEREIREYLRIHYGGGE